MVTDKYEQFLKKLYNQRNPRDYAQVSELFALNFQKIINLIPHLEYMSHNSFIKHPQEKDLYLLVEEKFAYTAIFTLTHQIGSIKRPDIKFKVYFDAKLLEAISICNETTLNNSHPYIAQCSDMDIKWELNDFVSKWLDYCLEKYQNLSWQTI